MYRPDADGTPGNDQYVHIQSNRVCIIGLAPSHPIIREQMHIKSVKFAQSVHAIEVSGKRKRGLVYVDHRTTLLTVHTVCGKTYGVRAGMRGDVMEVNSALLQLPDLLRSHPASAGHIAVLNLKLKSVLELHASLMPQEDYAELCALRGLPCMLDAALAWKASPVVQAEAGADALGQGSAASAGGAPGDTGVSTGGEQASSTASATEEGAAAEDGAEGSQTAR
jgi:hypothetical protein